MFVMTTIEDKEIRGITVKILFTIIISVVTIVTSILGSYFSLSNAISNQSEKVEQNNKYFDLKISTLENEVKKQQIEITDIYNRINKVK